LCFQFGNASAIRRRELITCLFQLTANAPDLLAYFLFAGN
jgi:hypothetical protein